MKVLIFTVTVGVGHNEVSKNIAEKFKEKGDEVLIHNLFENHRFYNWVLSKLGFQAMMKLPKIANFFYDNSKRKNKQLYENMIKSVKEKTLKVVNDFEPDVIISSHIAGLDFVKNYDGLFKKQVLNYFVITDYDVPPGLREFKNNEYIVIPNNDFKNELIEKGLDEEHLLPFGIPINKKYSIEISRQQALDKLDIELDENKQVILITGGGVGLGHSFKLIKELSKHEDLQIISVAGKNKKLKDKADVLAKNSRARIISLGFTKELEYIMTLTDVIVGKTGGITATEAIVKRVPFMAMKNTPKPEYSNLLYFIDKKIAIGIDSVKNVYDIIKNIDKTNIKEIIKNEFPKQDSCELIYKHIKETLKK